jgi:antitoxin HicB
MIYKIILDEAEEGGYNVSVPELPGCFTQGENLEEALEMAEEAIELYLEETQP